MLSERALRSDRASQNDAWLGHGRGNNCRVIGLLRETSLELARFHAPGFHSRLHGRRGDGQIEEA
jgi:hypothetical protein